MIESVYLYRHSDQSVLTTSGQSSLVFSGPFIYRARREGARLSGLVGRTLHDGSRGERTEAGHLHVQNLPLLRKPGRW